MALPTTGISISLVRNTIGAGSNDLGTLFLHPNVNEWGFNCMTLQEQNAVWGKPSSERAKLSPLHPNYTPIMSVEPGYNLGYFRRYDHDWVVYLLGGVQGQSTFYENNMIFKVLIEPLPKLIDKPAPTPAVEHTFKIEFARNPNQFDLGTATLVSNSFKAVAPFSTFEIEPIYPPDYETNGSLTPGQTIYLRVTHLSSPERRWTITTDVPVTISYTVPNSAFSNTMEYRNFKITAVKKITAPSVYVFTVEADLYADFSTQQIVDFTGTMSNTSNYSSNVFNLYDNGVVINPNTTPGTPTLVKHLMFDFSSTSIRSLVNPGNTVYGKIVAAGGPQYTGSAVVTSTPPIIILLNR
jgi:hypothetical protein